MTFREIRKSKGITMTYVAEYLKMSAQLLSLKELDKIKFSGREAQKLCKLYDVKIEDVDL